MPPPSANIFPCTHWIARGVAKSTPERLRLEPEQLRVVIESAQNKAKETRERIGNRPGVSSQQSNNNGEQPMELEGGPERSRDRVKINLDDDDVAIMQEYGLNDYDDDNIRINNNSNESKSDDDDEDIAGISGEQDLARDLAALTYYASNQDDPYLQDNQETNSDDEEEDDLTIKPTNNLIVCGHVSKGSSSLEVYVYDNEEKDFYLHHDIILTDYPCCVLWLGYAKGADNRNYAAVGDMSPGINLWDLDVVEVIEPLAHLEGHKDATIDLSWNTTIKNIMASGSADKTVRLWNLDECKSQSEIKMPGKVSSVEFNHIEPHLLLAGDLRKNISLIDTRCNESVNKWKICGEIEKVLWHPTEPTRFLVSDDHGYVYYYDSRSSNQVPLFKFQAHQSSVTGLKFSPVYKSMLVTASADDYIKVWDMSNVNITTNMGNLSANPPELIKELTDLKVGSILSLSMCPDLPAMVAVGGVSKCNSFKTYDLTMDPKDTGKLIVQSRWPRDKRKYEYFLLHAEYN